MVQRGEWSLGEGVGVRNGDSISIYGVGCLFCFIERGVSLCEECVIVNCRERVSC